MDTNRIIAGDSFQELQELPENSVHAVVTDPPYGLAFMGRSWDDFEPKEYQEWCQEWAEHVLRVLKPGGHMLAFSGNRTHHRLFTGVEDAGFEVRDTITWHYGSGFPKASDIGKTIDKRADAEREVTGTYGPNASDVNDSMWGSVDPSADEYDGSTLGVGKREETEPATPEAEKWDGWKTGLKPSTEYVVMARKPFDGATVDCVLEHGTGALNIDATRIGTEDDTSRVSNGFGTEDDLYGEGDMGGEVNESHDKGRYPSNVVFDETEAERLDEQVGELADSTQKTDKRGYDSNVYGDKVDKEAGGADGYPGSGGPSRYFYTSKASKAERTEDGSIDNSHPTVKPLDLMEWLIKMVSREGQIILDPFCGSGTTCKAAKGLNREFIGIEKQDKWADVARVRCGLTPTDPSVVRDDEEQNGLEEYV